MSVSFMDTPVMPKITKKTIDALLSQPGYHFLGEPSGFGVRVTPTGAMFFQQGRIKGSRKVIRVSLGKLGSITHHQARELALRTLGDFAKGIDPNAVAKESLRQERIVQSRRSATLRFVLENYLADRSSLKESTKRGYLKILNRCVSDWMDRPITEISKDMIERRFKDLGNTGLKRRSSDWNGKAQANQVMRILRALFNYAQHKFDDSDLQISINPVSRISQIKAWNKIPRRQTVLKAHELKPWHDAVETLENMIVRNYLKLLLFTGLRKEEASALQWKDIDFKSATLTVTDTKNGSVHTLPLTPHVSNFLLEIKKESSSTFVFPGDGASGHLVDPRKPMMEVTRKTGIEFTCHDLRRTFATVAEALDIQGYPLKRLLNHSTSNDVTAGYIVSDIERLRVPMERITNFILSKVETSEC